MSQALGERAAPARPRPNPSGPVEPLDVPELDDIPLGEDGSRVSIDREGLTVSTDVGGIPVDLRVDERGIGVEPGEEREPPPPR
jgi:penicillin-binding protein 1A